jgi:hypothetical protein
MPTKRLSNDILEAAILGYEEQKRQIDKKIAELQAILAERAEHAAKQPAPTRRLSVKGRSRIVATTKRRWAAARKRRTAGKRKTKTGTSGTGPRIAEEAESE